MRDLPDEVRNRAERLTRRARAAVDPAEANAYKRRRDELLAERGFVARVREDDATLILYPAEWVEDGTVRIDRIGDTDRAVEIPLSGAGDPEEWASVEAHNAGLVDRVAESHGEVHAANARAFADFMGNHYARRMETATASEIREFLDDYFPRNAWPTADQRAVVRESISFVFDAADADVPDYR